MADVGSVLAVISARRRDSDDDWRVSDGGRPLVVEAMAGGLG